MAGEIIRKGDKTSHDGVVLEGSMVHICLGRPVAFIGHKVHCPKCKGDYPIVEGSLALTLNGKGVALAGMKTSCGATLIASQFVDTVAGAGGGGAGATASSPAAAAAAAAVSAAAAVAQQEVAPAVDDFSDIFDEQYALLDEDGSPLADMPFTIKLRSGEYLQGVTDHMGRTGRYITEGAQAIEVHLGHIQA